MKKIIFTFFLFIYQPLLAQDFTAIIEQIEKKNFYGKQVALVPLKLILQYSLIALSDLEVADYQDKIHQARYLQSLGKFEPTLTTEIVSNSNPAVTGSTEGNLNFSRQNNTTISTSLSKKNLNGINYGISINVSSNASQNYQINKQQDIVSGEGNSDYTVFSNIFSVNIPIGQDWGDINFIESKSHLVDKENNKINKLEIIIAYFNGVSQLYWELVKIYAMFEQQKEKIQLAKQLYEESLQREEVGLTTAINVNNTLLLWNTEQINIIPLENVIIDLEEQIKVALDLLNLDLGLFPVDGFKTIAPESDSTFYYDKILQFHPVFLKFRVDAAKNMIEKEESENLLATDIDLNLRYNLTGAGFNVGESVENIPVTELDGYNIGLTWKHTFGNTKAQEKKSEVLHRKIQIETQKKSQGNNYLILVRKIFRELDFYKATIKNSQQRQEVALKFFQQEKLKYNNGEISSITLFEAQTEKTAAEFSFISAQAEYEKQYHELLILTGEIFPYYQIDIDTTKN